MQTSDARWLALISAARHDLPAQAHRHRVL
jgi:hypothetical protein